MKISKLEFENFRNFKDHGCVTFPTDGRVTIIYGTNGDGKTTLHQLFQWIFYGEVHFNRTASNKMYNLKMEREIPYGEKFSVHGTIDFEHPNRNGVVEHYSLHREWVYRKELQESKKVDESCHLLKLVDDDWKKVNEDPSVVIERMLPSGLSQYFFFDGESMIADLSQKGRDSAKSLRKALYSIFDLDIYEQAVVHIGTQGAGTSTVLGKLYLSKAEAGSSSDVIVARGAVHQAQGKLNGYTEERDNAENEINSLQRTVKELSELIGNTKPKAELERKRKTARDNIEKFETAISKEKIAFGNDILRTYPYLLISRVVQEAQCRIGLKVGDEKLIEGLKKPLIDAILADGICICGRELGKKEREELDKYLHMLPPLSYKSMYDNFKKDANRWTTHYDNKQLAEHLKTIFEYKDSISKLQIEISDIDEELKRSSEFDGVISKRAEAERSITYWDGKKRESEKNITLWEQYLKQRMKKYDQLADANKGSKVVAQKIEIMEAVKEFFENKLREVADDYSQKLGETIQDLLNQMLTSERHVSMTSKFELSVKDSFGDEAKSEGQFAVVSFAYIGGILKLLRDEPVLKDKEYPLILDGPFSKLDVIQRQNVIDTIPAYAPQIVLFSKDDISNCFADELSDCTWTIFGNREKNVAEVRHGYYPEVFTNNGNNN